MHVILMNKNNPVAKLNVEQIKQNGFPMLKILSCEITDKKLCPIILLKRDVDICQAVTTWLSRRIIPICRQEIYAPIFENQENSFDGYDKYHFFTLNDQYWIKYSNDESWEQLNFFTNNFCDIKNECSDSRIGDIFFSENLNGINNFKGNLHSPDLSTEGNMLKRWYKDGNRIFLCKTGKTSAIVNEIIATAILKELKNMGILSNEFKFVNYKLGIYNNKLCSCSNNFMTVDTELVTAYEIYSSVPFSSEERSLSPPEQAFSHLIKSVKHYNIPGAEAFINEMNIADAYLNYYDRHLRNFGFFRNVNTGEFSGPVPLFDFGEIFISEEKKDAEHDLFNNQRKKIKPKLSKEQADNLKTIVNDCDLISEKFKQQASLQIEQRIKNKNEKNLSQEDL